MSLSRRDLFLAAAGASVCAKGWAQKKTFKMVYFQDYEPFSSGQEQQVVGLYIDILNEVIGKHLGIEVEHRGLPWARAQAMVKDGEADAFVSLVTPERQAYAVAGSVPVYDSHNYMYAAANHPKLDALRSATQLSDLQPYSIGTYAGVSLIKTVFAGMKIVTTSTQAQATQMTLEQRVDLTFGNDLQTVSTLKAMNRAKGLVRLLRVSDKPLSASLQIGKTSPWLDILPKVDKLLADMKKDGRYEKLIDRYS